MLEIIIFFAKLNKFKQIYWKLSKFIAKLNKFIEKSININIIILVFNIVHFWLFVHDILKKSIRGNIKWKWKIFCIVLLK